MEKQKIEIGRPVTVGNLRIIPVAEVVFKYRGRKKNVASFGLKRPVGSVVLLPDGPQAFRATGEAVSVEQLAQEFPEMKDTLAAI